MIVFVPVIVYFSDSIRKAILKLFKAYFKTLSFSDDESKSDGEESVDAPFGEYHEEKGVVFFPPVYAQRYAAVVDCLIDDRWSGKLKKVIDFGYHDTSFIKHLMNVPGVTTILGVDLDSIPLQCTRDLLNFEKNINNKELVIQLYQGNAADPDYRLIGCDAVVAIEMIEHMLPFDLERFVHTIFGFIKPNVAIITTPNGDFNVLFKALESNGLRRLDHFFEWSQDQFHEWCSNIVTRYPQYTVTCKGIGPGPPGTEHLGCCSQLAMFINEDYHKQPDLNMNSLALVPEMVKSDSDLSEWFDYRTVTSSETNYRNYSSLTFPSNKTSTTSCSTFESYKTFETGSSDKILQCDMDLENSKCFLMFNEDLGFNVLIPRRITRPSNYIIEDVTRRLNCSISHVKNFSEKSLNMIIKDKNCSQEHIKDISSNIYELIEMLQLKECSSVKKAGIWYNINWGEDAPYWNQYYKLIKEYKYPFKPKTDDEQILDIISEELHNSLDKISETHNDVDIKVTIPIAHIMELVQHISDDEDKIRELLDWNGYEVADNALVHSRRIEHCDDDSDGCNYLNNKTLFLKKTGALENYNVMIHSVLLKKISKIRLIISQEQFETNLESKIFCHLASLSLAYTKHRNKLPQFLWFQCKLYDLLIIYERSEEYRKRIYFETYIFSNNEDNDAIKENVDLAKYKNDSIPNNIFNKYKNLLDDSKGKTKNKVKLNKHKNISQTSDAKSELVFLQESDFSLVSKKLSLTKTVNGSDRSEINFDFENSSGVTSNPSNALSLLSIESSENILKDTNLAIIANQTSNSIKSDKDTILVTNNLPIENSDHSDLKELNVIYSEPISEICNNLDDIKDDIKNCNTIIAIDNIIKNTMINDELNSTTLAKPIPNDLLELCKLKEQNDNIDLKEKYSRETLPAKTEHSLLIYVVREDAEETIALRRTIATDTDCLQIYSNYFNQNIDLEDYNINISDPILLEDENEPTTSKGLRHSNFDVQCGSDTAISVSLCNLLPEQELTNNKETNNSITPIISEANFDTNTHLDTADEDGSEHSIIRGGIVIKNILSKMFINKNCYENHETIKLKSLSDISQSYKDITCTETKAECYNSYDTNISLHWLPIKSYENIIRTNNKILRNKANVDIIEDLDISSDKQSKPEINEYDLNKSKDLDTTFITTFTNRILKPFLYDLKPQNNNVSEISPATIYIKNSNLTRGSIQMHSYQQRQVSEDVLYQGNLRPQSLSIKKCLQNKNNNSKGKLLQKSFTKGNSNLSKSDSDKNTMLYRITCDQKRNNMTCLGKINKKISPPNKRIGSFKKQTSNSNDLEKYFIDKRLDPKKFINENKLKDNKNYHKTCKFSTNVDNEYKVCKFSTRNNINERRGLNIKSRTSLLSSRYSGTRTVRIASDKTKKSPGNHPSQKSNEVNKIVKMNLKTFKQAIKGNKENILMDDNFYYFTDNEGHNLSISESNDNKIYKFENMQVATLFNNHSNETDEKTIMLENIISKHNVKLPFVEDNKVKLPDTILPVKSSQLCQSTSTSHGFLTHIIDNVLDDVLDDSEANSVESGDSVKTSIQILPLKSSSINVYAEAEQLTNVASVPESEFLISDTNLDTSVCITDNSYPYESTSQGSEGISTRRSSIASYQSCQTEEIFSPPDWMFTDRDTDEDSLELGSSVEASMILNANDSGHPIDNIIAPGAGAGDGRGIHSDYSHDSSDRDMSNSSDNTDVSSRTLSEVMSMSSTSISDQPSSSFGSTFVQNEQDLDNITITPQNGTRTIHNEFGANMSFDNFHI